MEELARLRKEVQTHAEHQQAQERDWQEKTRAVLQDLKFYVVDLPHRPWNVPREAEAAAKVAIEFKLRGLSVLELPYLELYEIASAVQDRIYQGYTSPRANAPHAHNPEVLMPKTKLLTALYACPECNAEYDLEQTPEPEAVCEECDTPLEEYEDEEEA